MKINLFDWNCSKKMHDYEEISGKKSQTLRSCTLVERSSSQLEKLTYNNVRTYKDLSKLTTNINEKPSDSKNECDQQFHSQNSKKAQLTIATTSFFYVSWDLSRLAIILSNSGKTFSNLLHFFQLLTHTVVSVCKCGLETFLAAII